MDHPVEFSLDGAGVPRIELSCDCRLSIHTSPSLPVSINWFLEKVMRMSSREFEQLVTESLKLIPAEFQPFLDNIQFVIEEEPTDELLNELGVPANETLYGLYTGTPLIERTLDYDGFPDRITIYRAPLLEDFDDRNELRHEVARTVLHEVAHHFGIEEDRLTELGWD